MSCMSDARMSSVMSTVIKIPCSLLSLGNSINSGNSCPWRLSLILFQWKAIAHDALSSAAPMARCEAESNLVVLEGARRTRNWLMRKGDGVHCPGMGVARAPPLSLSLPPSRSHPHRRRACRRGCARLSQRWASRNRVRATGGADSTARARARSRRGR